MPDDGAVAPEGCTYEIQIEFGYQGANTAAPGLPNNGATITVSFDNGTMQDDGLTVYWGDPGQRPNDYPVVFSSWSATSATFEGNINNLYASATVDTSAGSGAASPPLTGTISTNIALPFAVPSSTSRAPAFRPSFPRDRRRRNSA